ncbi:precorrin-6y C5,15-methyltransferase (decarboxylating) subunit CbiE [Halorhodospira halochloris]|uniref:precorrin-6y C5,15-methyltransferase (decarboxylating) subunit CbiE n=1 Tax=Halorhodospira halochloris TaxID=1052 RepID=UPI001EE82305|nr:precorrin-6y C5,15-methyltransferase (decarboxylating) subunit CbiE [Halorhodospira halochloris]MCG5530697.1 precorrin-6y C5,15-methyltransferase (decarboxylating) subunit CbiE [Halorhodospira halochloris]
METGQYGNWLTVIGVGEDGEEGLAPAARSIIRNAELVVGGSRHLDLVAGLINGQRLIWSSPLSATLPQLLDWRGQRVVVMASGDPLFFGVGSTLQRYLPLEEMSFIPHPSCVSLAAARLGWTQQDCTTISLSGRPLESLRAILQPGRGVFVLSADASTPFRVASALVEWGFGATTICVLEALGGPREAIRHYSATDLAQNTEKKTEKTEGQAQSPLNSGNTGGQAQKVGQAGVEGGQAQGSVDKRANGDVPAFAQINLLALDVIADSGARIIPFVPGLADDWFEHDGQITKREIRSTTLSSLRPQHRQMLWDVGCGSGSIAIEWLLADFSTKAVAIDYEPERADRAARNAAAFGVPRLDVRTGLAPKIFADLPTPDAIFLGGGLRDINVIKAAWDALPGGGRLVANAVVIETEQLLYQGWQNYGGSLSRLSVERLGNVGSLHAFRPSMTVLQWVAEK